MRTESSWQALRTTLRTPAFLLRTLADDTVTTLLPADCQCCDDPLTRAGSVPVCQVCLASVLPCLLFSCNRCGEAADLDLDLEEQRFAGLTANGFLCRACRLAEPPFARANAFGVYDGVLRDLVKMLKFDGLRSVAPLLAPHMAQAILSLENSAANDLLVIAVPLFRSRQRQRGFNQSVLLAGAALRRLKHMRPQWRLQPAHNLLVRKHRTESQYVLSARDRRRNLEGAFEVRPRLRNLLQGREVLLVDDIFTSGATARECSKVLLKAGAAKVWVATLARAQKSFVRRQHEDPGVYVATWDLPATGPGKHLEHTINGGR